MSSRTVLPRLRSSLGSMAAVVGILAFLAFAFFDGAPDLGGAGRAVVTADSDPSAAVSALKRRDDSIYGDSNLHDLLDGVEPNDVGSTPPSDGNESPIDASGNPTGDVSADDGELHDAWNENVGYSYASEAYRHTEKESIAAYGSTVLTDFDVAYPQFHGGIANVDQVNETLRQTAMRFVSDSYESPTDYYRSVMASVIEDGYGSGGKGGYGALLKNHVTYAISYNSDKLVSVCFSDHYFVGSIYGEFNALRTVNIDVGTGEIYALDDVLDVTDDIANSWIDVCVAQNGTDEDGDGQISADECLLTKIASREQLVQALKGQGELAQRFQTTFFVDGNGKVNLGVTFWVSKDGSFIRGWQEMTVPDGELVIARRDSTFWSLLPAPGA